MLAPPGALDVAMEPALGGQAGPVWEERPGQLLERLLSGFTGCTLSALQ